MAFKPVYDIDQTLVPLSNYAEELARKKVTHIMVNREKLVEAFIAETGLKPSECEMVIQITEDGVQTHWCRRLATAAEKMIQEAEKARSKP